MKYTDIYSNKVTVNEYQDTHSYVSNPKVLERVVKLLSNTINNFLAKENILLYDLGCGSGEIDISLYNYLHKEYIDFFCIDNSDVMLKLFEHNLHSNKKLRSISNIKLVKHDLEYGIRDNSREIADFVLAFSSLHHVSNIEILIKSVFDLLKPNGVFIVVNVIGDYEIINGNFVNTRKYLKDPSRINFFNFWKKYFTFKNEIYKWEPKYRASDYKYIHEIIKKNFFQSIYTKRMYFSKNIVYKEFINWINSKALTGISIGLKHIEIKKLINKMSDYLSDNNLLEHDYTLKLGLEFNCYFKKSAT